MSKKLFHYVVLVAFVLWVFVACSSTKATYEVVYLDGDFSIRESRIGNTESIQWTKLPIPEKRIKVAIPSLDVENKQFSHSNADGFLFSQIIRVPTSNESTNIFELESDYLGGSGNAVLKRNGQVIWEGFMDGGTDFPIHSFSNLNGEIIFSYNDYSNSAQNQITDYVVYSEGDKAIVIPSAFGPQVIHGQAIYFQKVGDQITVTRNGVSVGELYNSVLQACCGYETAYGILQNENIVDFFAIRNKDWYHVQVGFEQ